MAYPSLDLSPTLLAMMLPSGCRHTCLRIALLIAWYHGQGDGEVKGHTRRKSDTTRYHLDRRGHEESNRALHKQNLEPTVCLGLARQHKLIGSFLASDNYCVCVFQTCSVQQDKSGLWAGRIMMQRLLRTSGYVN